MGAGNWGRKNWAEECSIIIDTGFNGGGFRRLSWLGEYAEYFGIFYRNAKLAEIKEKELGFAFGDQQERVSVTSTVVHIGVNGPFKPVRIRLIGGGQNYFRA